MARNFHACSTSKLVLILTTVCLFNIQALWFESDFIGIENSKTGIARTDLRIIRKTKVPISIHGTVEFTEDFKDDYDVEIRLFYSSKGNNQYVQLPFKVTRGSCCKLMENVYWTSIHKELESVSDFPKRNGTEPLCFLYKKGIFTIRGFGFDRNVIPKFIESGTYKAEFSIFKKESQEVDSRFTLIGRLY